MLSLRGLVLIYELLSVVIERVNMLMVTIVITYLALHINTILHEIKCHEKMAIATLMLCFTKYILSILSNFSKNNNNNLFPRITHDLYIFVCGD